MIESMSVLPIFVALACLILVGCGRDEKTSRENFKAEKENKSEEIIRLLRKAEERAIKTEEEAKKEKRYAELNKIDEDYKKNINDERERYMKGKKFLIDVKYKFASTPENTPARLQMLNDILDAEHEKRKMLINKSYDHLKENIRNEKYTLYERRNDFITKCQEFETRINKIKLEEEKERLDLLMNLSKSTRAKERDNLRSQINGLEEKYLQRCDKIRVEQKEYIDSFDVE